MILTIKNAAINVKRLGNSELHVLLDFDYDMEKTNLTMVSAMDFLLFGCLLLGIRAGNSVIILEFSLAINVYGMKTINVLVRDFLLNRRIVLFRSLRHQRIRKIFI